MNPVDNMYYDNVWYVKVFKDKVKVEISHFGEMFTD